MIVIPIGTKGMLIKMAGVIKELDKIGLEYYLISLNEHGRSLNKIRELFNIREFDLEVEYPLDVSSVREIPVWLLRVLKGSLIRETKTGCIVLIQGDTASSLVSLCLSIKAKKKVAHIEAGLRSGDIFNPFPEEIIRRIIDKFSSILYAPTIWAYKNLRNEKINGDIVYTRGNTVKDAVRYALERKSALSPPNEPFILLSIHRVENIFSSKRIKLLYKAIEHVNLPIIWPLHESTKKRLVKSKLYSKFINKDNIRFMGLMDYISFIHFMKRAEFIITDGGGPQEEAFYLGTPCLIFRKKTEHIEGIRWNAELSEYNLRKIFDFISNYHSFRKKQILTSPSPSEIIARDIKARIEE